MCIHKNLKNERIWYDPRKKMLYHNFYDTNAHQQATIFTDKIKIKSIHNSTSTEK